MFTKGYIKLWRGIQDNHLYFSKEFCPTMAWIDLLLLANFKSHTTYIRGIPVEVKAGQVLASLGFLGLRWKWSPNKVKRYLKYLSSENVRQISIVKSNVCTIVTILNWDQYQGNGTENGTQTAGRWNADGMQTETLEERKEREEGKEGLHSHGSDRKPSQDISDLRDIPHVEMKNSWNELCKESSLMRCKVWPEDAVSTLWRFAWFSDNWELIFETAHENEWCNENRVGLRHVLKLENARNFCDEAFDSIERWGREG